MLVCICNAISEHDLRAVAREGQTCPEAAYAMLGKTPQCRICLEHAEDILSEEQMEARGRQCPGFAAAMRITASISAA